MTDGALFRLRAFCFLALIGCFDQRLFGDPAPLSKGQAQEKWQLARLEGPLLESLQR